MRMLAGLILPTAGRIAIDGIELPSDSRPRARQGRTPDRGAGTWERLTVRSTS